MTNDVQTTSGTPQHACLPAGGERLTYRREHMEGVRFNLRQKLYLNDRFQDEPDIHLYFAIVVWPYPET